MTVVFGSEEWLAALGEELAAAPALEATGSLRIGHLVLAEDGTERWSYTVELAGGRPPRLVGAGVESAEVTLVAPEAAARTLAAGAASASSLLEAGAVKIRGDARALMGAVHLLEEAARSSGTLAGRTVFGDS